MTKHAVGVFNGNWRDGDYYRYGQDVKRADKFTVDFNNATEDLRDLLGDSFDAWWDSYPPTMSKGDFLPIMKAKIVELQTAHAVEDATALEPEFCSGAEPREAVSEFTQADDDERGDLYLLGMGA